MTLTTTPFYGIIIVTKLRKDISFMTTSITQPTIQLSIFEDNYLGDLEKVLLLFQTLPDESLLTTLNADRGKGRNDNPNQMMWYCILAMFVLEHPTIQSFRREMNRNRQLREVVGYQPVKKMVTIGKKGNKQRVERLFLSPHSSAFTGFINRLIKYEQEVQKIFEDLVDQLYRLLPDFGTELIADGKIIETFAKWKSKKAPDGRRDTESTSTAKVYITTTESGEVKGKVTWYHGYRDHVIVDAATGLPIAHDLRTAKENEQTVLLEMLPHLSEMQKKRGVHFLADKGYDSTAIRKKLEGYTIKPVIDTRKFQRDGMDECRYKDTNLWYNYQGKFFFEEDGKLKPMRYLGYDKERDTLRYTYPIWHPSNEVIRVDRSEDPRIFTQIPIHTLKFERIYKKRTEIERTFAQLDRDLGFENHTIRGKKKMNLFVTLAYIVMNGYAIGKLLQGEANFRSLRAA